VAQLEKESGTAAVQAFRIGDGSAFRICDLCWLQWSGDGKYFYLSFEVIVKSNSTRARFMRFCSSPVRKHLHCRQAGCESESAIAKLGRSYNRRGKAVEFAPGPLPNIFSQPTMQRSLYRVPLP
jgi:hypothetical protein